MGVENVLWGEGRLVGWTFNVENGIGEINVKIKFQRKTANFYFVTNLLIFPTKWKTSLLGFHLEDLKKTCNIK